MLSATRAAGIAHVRTGQLISLIPSKESNGTAPGRTGAMSVLALLQESIDFMDTIQNLQTNAQRKLVRPRIDGSTTTSCLCVLRSQMPTGVGTLLQQPHTRQE